jgi:hypothetical protein
MRHWPNDIWHICFGNDNPEFNQKPRTASVISTEEALTVRSRGLERTPRMMSDIENTLNIAGPRKNETRDEGLEAKQAKECQDVV